MPLIKSELRNNPSLGMAIPSEFHPTAVSDLTFLAKANCLTGS
ncbi:MULTISPECIES: hypothetical protein [unclassified Roseobacter]|nr:MULTISPECIES: hypothetical protein [unclassified Roseobacter]